MGLSSQENKRPIRKTLSSALKMEREWSVKCFSGSHQDEVKGIQHKNV